MFPRRNPQLRWALGVLFWVLLATALVRALWPDPFTEPYVGHWDKVTHAAGCFVLTLLAAAAYPRVRLPLLGTGILGFGVLVEILQAIPIFRRDASVWDLLADTVGICVALIPTALPALRGALRRRYG